MDKALRNIRTLCLVNAAELIEASAKLLESNAHPHISYHLSLLALEEIGKGCMVAARAIVGNNLDSGWMDKWLSNHRRKLQWAVWSPMNRIDPADFEDARKFAESVHARRLASLYVDVDADIADLPAKNNVTVEDATSLLALARSRLALDEASGGPSGEVDDTLKWYLATIDDPAASKRLFSKPFLDKYAELDGDTRAWAQWASAEFDRLDAESATILEAELTRPVSSAKGGKPRWQGQSVIYTPSHSIRPKVLNYWNDRIDMVKLLWTDKKDQFLLEITMPDSVGVKEINARSVSLAKLIVACLNIGSLGYFWFQPPGFQHEVFRQFRDLENSGSSVRFEQPGSFWGNGRAVALEERHMQHATECMMAYAPMPRREAEPIFRPYLDGLAFIAKSDVYYSMEELARASFVSALAGALMQFGDWDGQDNTFEAQLNTAFEPFMPDSEHRKIVFEALKAKPTNTNSSLENLRTAKHVTDLYLVHIAKLRWKDILKVRIGKAEPPAASE